MMQLKVADRCIQERWVYLTALQELFLGSIAHCTRLPCSYVSTCSWSISQHLSVNDKPVCVVGVLLL